MAEIVYIFTNPMLWDVIKIGKTNRDNVSIRLKELFTTAVVLPYDCAYACTVDDNTAVEKEMHELFSKDRIYIGREYFWVKVKAAMKALKSYEIEDVTPELRTSGDGALSEELKEARWKARQRREKYDRKYAKGKTLHSKLK